MNMTCTPRLVCRDESVGESTLTSRINKKRQTKKTPKANQILLQRDSFAYCNRVKMLHAQVTVWRWPACQKGNARLEK